MGLDPSAITLIAELMCFEAEKMSGLGLAVADLVESSASDSFRPHEGLSHDTLDERLAICEAKREGDFWSLIRFHGNTLGSEHSRFRENAANPVVLDSQQAPPPNVQPRYWQRV